jgi:hypothetical protein
MQKNDTLNSRPVDKNLGRAATSLFAAGVVEEAELESRNICLTAGSDDCR